MINNKIYIPYLLVALVVLVPLLGPGFVLTLDMVFVPEPAMPRAVTSSYLFHAGLHYLSLLIPSDVLQKIMLMSILLLAGIGMHRLIKTIQTNAKGGDLAVYIGSIFFMINPFTYSRFMAGQYAVLLGYALLPWFAKLLLEFGGNPKLRTGLKLGGLATIISIVSIHTVGMLALLALVGAGVALWYGKQRLRAYLRYGLVALGLFVVASSYWLIPLALGKGTTANVINQFTATDSAVFATTGGNPPARAGNILRLQGFWAEDRGLYLLPQDRAVLWGLMALIIIGLVIWGGTALWRRHRTVLVWLATSAFVAMLLAAGAMQPLAEHGSLLAGYREPHKLVGLVALTYSVLLAFGVRAVLAQVRRRSNVAHGITMGLLVLLPFLFTRTMLWGFDGQLTPRHYPADWTSLNHRLQKDSDDFAVLFLPWHQYMSFQFAGRIIANPAPAFFTKPTIVSADPELGGATSGRATDTQKALHTILATPNKTDLAEALTAHNIKYIILAKELDYRDYDYLNAQVQLEQIDEYSTTTLYKNQAWREQ